MEGLVLCYALVLSRIGAFIAVLPVLGGSAVPRLVKTGLALALTTFYFLHWEGTLHPSSLTETSHVSWLFFGLVLAREALLGALLGFAMGLVLLPVKVAGSYLAQEMGLALGQLVGPVSPDPATVVSGLFEALATLLLLGLNGHHLFLATLQGAFIRYPIHHPFGPPPIGDLVTSLARSQEWGLLLAAPLGVALFLLSVVLALMTRAVPQMNLFSIGFSVRVVGGLVGALLLLPDFVRGVVNVFAQFNGLLRGFV